MFEIKLKFIIEILFEFDLKFKAITLKKKIDKLINKYLLKNVIKWKNKIIF